LPEDTSQIMVVVLPAIERHNQ